MELTRLRAHSELRPHGRITLCLFDAELAPTYAAAARLRAGRRWMARRSRPNLLTNNGIAFLAAAINGVAVQNQNAGWGYPVPAINLGNVWGAVGSSQTAATVNDYYLGAELTSGRAVIANGISAVNQVAWDFFFATTQANGTIWEAGAFLQAIGPPPPPSVAPVGTTGAATWGYQVVAVGGATNSDSAPSTATTITNGNATLNGTNYNTISWQAVTGATGYKVIRSTVTGTTLQTGAIGGTLGPTVLSLNDTGLTTTGYIASSSPGTMLDHTIFGSSTVKNNTQTGILEVALTLLTS